MQCTVSERLVDILCQRANQDPNGLLFTRGQQSWSNGEFYAVCRRLASRLQEDAGSAGAIGVSAESSGLLPFLIWSSVLAKVDLWLLPALPTESALQQSIRSLPLQVVYSDARILEENERVRPLSGLLEDLPSEDIDLPIDSDGRSAFVFQTSGTEGAPKSIRCEHWQFARVIAAMSTCGALEHANGVRAYISQPLQHSYGLCSFLEYCAAGASILLPAERSPLGPVGDLMNTGDLVQAIEGVPYFWSQFAQLQTRLDLPALRHLGIGGGRVDPAVMQKVLTRYPHATVSVRYGLTETPSVATHKIYKPPHGNNWSSSGRIVPAYQVEIHDSTGHVVSSGTEGEIVVSGEAVAVPSRVLHTGDLGYFDEANELVVTGRRSAFIKRRGYRLSPEAIESVAADCSGVVDCRAIGRDERLILEVVGPDELSIPLLMEQLRHQLPSAMVPDEVQRVQSIERTYSGKIKRS